MADITKWDPFSGLNSLHGQLDDMFNNFFGSPLARLSGNIPAVDVYSEDDKQLVTEVQAPGFDKSDIDVSVHEGVLEIKGEKHDKQEKGKKRDYVMRESHTSFYRRFALPKNADGGKVKASFDNGVLKVTVPFKKLPAPKKIAIDSGKK